MSSMADTPQSISAAGDPRSTTRQYTIDPGESKYSRESKATGGVPPPQIIALIPERRICTRPGILRQARVVCKSDISRQGSLRGIPAVRVLEPPLRSTSCICNPKYHLHSSISFKLHQTTKSTLSLNSWPRATAGRTNTPMAACRYCCHPQDPLTGCFRAICGVPLAGVFGV